MLNPGQFVVARQDIFMPGHHPPSLGAKTFVMPGSGSTKVDILKWGLEMGRGKYIYFKVGIGNGSRKRYILK